MPHFNYTAVDHHGQEHKGSMTVHNKQEVLSFIQNQNWICLQIKPKAPYQRFATLRWFYPKLSTNHLVQLTQLLSTLIGAGVPIDEALELIYHHIKGKSVSQSIRSLMLNLQQGMSFAQALEQQQHNFPVVYVASVYAAESSGKLAQVLEGLATYTTERSETLQRIKAALIYPAIILSVAFAVVVLLMVYVVPSVTSVIAQNGTELPIITQWLLAVSDWLTTYGILMSLGMLLGLLAGAWLMKINSVAYKAHRILLWTPFVSRWLKRTNAIYVCRTLALLMNSGVPVLEALSNTSLGVMNQFHKQQLYAVEQSLKEGNSLYHSLKSTDLLPDIALRLVASGEASGQLYSMLNKTGEILEKQQQHAIRVGLALLEPLMMLILGGVVLLIVLAILLPIFEMNQLAV